MQSFYVENTIFEILSISERIFDGLPVYCASSNETLWRPIKHYDLSCGYNELGSIIGLLKHNWYVAKTVAWMLFNWVKSIFKIGGL